jgi:transcriptional regulator with XRE-family HTH domain
MLAVQSAPEKTRQRPVEDDVGASIRESFRLSIIEILRVLEALGIQHQVIAKRMGWAPNMVSKMKAGHYFPGPDVMERLLQVLSDYIELEPSDLLRYHLNKDNLLRELIRRGDHGSHKRT